MREGWDALHSSASGNEGGLLRFTSEHQDAGVALGVLHCEPGGMEEASREALRRIEEKQCAENFAGMGFRRIYGYGIAFSDKDCFITGKAFGRNAGPAA